MLIPARVPPHKPIDEEPGIEHRLEMCRLAVRGDETRLLVSDLEARRAGTSYTVDTLEELHTASPENEMVLIVGGDIAAGFGAWRDPARVLSLAGLAVATRPGTPREQVEEALSQVEGAQRCTFFAMPEIGISSTMLRDRIRSGEPTRYLMPEAVREYADAHRLYRGSPTP